MPRRRTTKDKTKRPGPTIPSGDEGANIGVECRKEKVKTLIEDFENEVQSKFRELDIMEEKLMRQIDTAYSLELLEIPVDFRDVKLRDFINNGGTFEVKALPICSEVDSVLNAGTNAGAGASTSLLQTIEEDENVPTTTTKKGRPGRKKTDAPPTTLRRGRSRLQTGDTSMMQTPANSTRSAMSIMTPLITPKFDPRLYQTAAVTKRMPKPDEVVVSMDGSPLMNCNETNKIVLPVNNSQTIAVQDVSELSNLGLDSSSAAAALHSVEQTMHSLQQMKEHLNAVVNFNKPPAK